MCKRMKRLLFLTTILLAASSSALAQRLQITLKDKSVVSYDIADINVIDIMPELQPGELWGAWFLVFRSTTSSSTHYDGTEMLTFTGSRMTWYRASGDEVYDITYSDDFKTLNCTSQETGNVESYTILANEPDLLVLKRASSIRYFYKSIEAAHNATMVKFPNRNEYTDINRILNLRSGSSNSTVTPMGKHFENKHKTTDADRAWLADPSNQPNVSISGLTKWAGKAVTLYPYGDPQPADINQHAIGDCCLCAVLASFAYNYPDYIKHIITQEGSTRFTVAMYDPQGNPVNVTVDNKFLCDGNNNIGQLTGKNNVPTWGTVLEKAIMKWETIYQCNGIEGIGTEHVAPLLTGSGNSFAISPGTLFNNEMKAVLEWAMQNGMIGVGGFNKGDLLCGTLNTVTGHAFTLMYTTDPDNYLFSMRNPWGITSVDGVLEIPDYRYIVQTIDFRLVYPGAAKEFLKQNQTGYVVPRFAPKQGDLGVSKRLLRMAGVNSYAGETGDDAYSDEEE